RQLKRRDLSLAMALDAALVEDRRDVLAVSDRAVRLGSAGPADKTAGRFDVPLGHGLAIEHFLDRINKVRRAWLVELEADAVLIVDAAPVTSYALAIEQVDRRRTLSAELICDLVAGVLEQRKTD